MAKIDPDHVTSELGSVFAVESTAPPTPPRAPASRLGAIARWSGIAAAIITFAATALTGFSDGLGVVDRVLPWLWFEPLRGQVIDTFVPMPSSVDCPARAKKPIKLKRGPDPLERGSSSSDSLPLGTCLVLTRACVLLIENRGRTPSTLIEVKAPGSNSFVPFATPLSSGTVVAGYVKRYRGPIKLGELRPTDGIVLYLSGPQLQCEDIAVTHANGTAALHVERAAIWMP